MFKSGWTDLRSGIALKVLSLALSVAPEQEKAALAEAIQSFISAADRIEQRRTKNSA